MSTTDSGVRGADPEALAALTRLLDLVADGLDHVWAELRVAVDGLTVVPAIDRISAVSAWLRDAANTGRRVALHVLSDGQPWRHRDFLDHIGGVRGSFGSGFVSGAGGIVRGLWAAVETSGQNVAAGAVGAWDAS